MTLHYIHVGKTGGTAIKDALRNAGLAYYKSADAASVPETPYGRIKLHGHDFRLHQVRPGEHAFFCVRDPVSRFVSGFNSRLRQGQPRYHVPWTASEQKVFSVFQTPRQLASALAGEDADERAFAEWCMRHVRHLELQSELLGNPRELSAHIKKVIYIGLQETLDADWAQLKALLGLPPDVELPRDPVRAHRAPGAQDT